MSPSQPSKSPARHSDTKETREGSQRPQEPRVRSILIEPRETEPPRVSVSVEYSDRAPNLKQLKKLAVDVAHDAVSAEAYVDLGYRTQAQNKILVQQFSLEGSGK